VTEKDAKALMKDLRDVKMLLILQLLEGGSTQTRIASILEISPATMSRMMPKGFSKALRKTEE
jgi:predicted transcriptional regulator